MTPYLFLLHETPSILKQLKKSGLTNKNKDKVKIIFYPAPVSLTDNVLSLHYSEVIMGMHLGIFPSLNEPWGYTPLETAASGVLTVTTNLAGFGDYVRGHINKEPRGIFILDRKNLDFDKTSGELCDIMYGVTKLSRGERVQLKENAIKITRKCDWNKLYKYHLKAHKMALMRKNKRVKHH